MKNVNEYFLGLAWTTIWKPEVRVLIGEESQTSL